MPGDRCRRAPSSLKVQAGSVLTTGIVRSGTRPPRRIRPPRGGGASRPGAPGGRCRAFEQSRPGETSAFAHSDLCPFKIDAVRPRGSGGSSHGGVRKPGRAPLDRAQPHRCRRTLRKVRSRPAWSQCDGRARRSRSSSTGSFSRANGTRGHAPASALLRPHDSTAPGRGSAASTVEGTPSLAPR